MAGANTGAIGEQLITDSQVAVAIEQVGRESARITDKAVAAKIEAMFGVLVTPQAIGKRRKLLPKRGITVVIPSPPPKAPPVTFVESVEKNLDAAAKLLRTMRPIEQLLEACEEWLQDPEDPEKFDLGPRADEIEVVYYVVEGKGREAQRRKKRSSLANLLARITEHDEQVYAGATFDGFEVVNSKQADPRSLLNQTARELRSCLETASTLMVQMMQVRLIQTFLARVTEIVEGADPDARDRIYAALADDGGLIELSRLLREQVGEGGEGRGR